VLTDGLVAPPVGRPPAARHGHDLIIYEMHVRGFTHRANSNVREEQRGTFAGVVAKIPCLRELGITAVELMPVQQFEPATSNYWGST
jgi:glycogen operon protein